MFIVSVYPAFLSFKGINLPIIRAASNYDYEMIPVKSENVIDNFNIDLDDHFPFSTNKYDKEKPGCCMFCQDDIEDDKYTSFCGACNSENIHNECFPDFIYRHTAVKSTYNKKKCLCKRLYTCSYQFLKLCKILFKKDVTAENMANIKTSTIVSLMNTKPYKLKAKKEIMQKFVQEATNEIQHAIKIRDFLKNIDQEEMQYLNACKIEYQSAKTPFLEFILNISNYHMFKNLPNDLILIAPGEKNSSPTFLKILLWCNPTGLDLTIKEEIEIPQFTTVVPSIRILDLHFYYKFNNILLDILNTYQNNNIEYINLYNNEENRDKNDPLCFYIVESTNMVPYPFLSSISILNYDINEVQTIMWILSAIKSKREITYFIKIREKTKLLKVERPKKTLQNILYFFFVTENVILKELMWLVNQYVHSDSLTLCFDKESHIDDIFLICVEDKIKHLTIEIQTEQYVDVGDRLYINNHNITILNIINLLHSSQLGLHNIYTMSNIQTKNLIQLRLQRVTIRDADLALFLHHAINLKIIHIINSLYTIYDSNCILKSQIPKILVLEEIKFVNIIEFLNIFTGVRLLHFRMKPEDLETIKNYRNTEFFLPHLKTIKIDPTHVFHEFNKFASAIKILRKLFKATKRINIEFIQFDKKTKLYKERRTREYFQIDSYFF